VIMTNHRSTSIARTVTRWTPIRARGPSCYGKTVSGFLRAALVKTVLEAPKGVSRSASHYASRSVPRLRLSPTSAA